MPPSPVSGNKVCRITILIYTCICKKETFFILLLDWKFTQQQAYIFCPGVLEEKRGHRYKMGWGTACHSGIQDHLVNSQFIGNSSSFQNWTKRGKLDEDHHNLGYRIEWSRGCDGRPTGMSKEGHGWAWHANIETQGHCLEPSLSAMECFRTCTNPQGACRLVTMSHISSDHIPSPPQHQRSKRGRRSGEQETTLQLWLLGWLLEPQSSLCWKNRGKIVINRTKF